MALAARIRRARRIAGISQQALADKLGVTRSAVGNWESDSGAHPATDRLAVLARELHVCFEWLATGRGEMRICAAVKEKFPTDSVTMIDCPHELQLLHAYRRAPTRVKALLQELANLHSPPSRPRNSKSAVTDLYAA